MSRVVILGAGSSKDCGLPLGDEIWSKFKETLTPKTGYPWFSCINCIFPKFWTGERRYPTFELFLTLIDRHIRRKENLGMYSCEDLKKIREVLVKRYAEIFQRLCLYAKHIFIPNPPPLVKKINKNFVWYKNFFRKIIKESNEIVFISINYDVLLDLVLTDLVNSREIKNFSYGFNVHKLEKQNEKCRTSGILFLKPHGSINFLQCPNPKCKKIFTISYSAQGHNKPGLYKCESCNINLGVAILPPTFDKSQEVRSFLSIHQKISEVISKADEILIIGYSLPDYDLNIIKAFLEGTLRNKNRLELKVKIITKEEKKQEMKSKYEAIFNRSVQYYGEGFKKYAQNFLAGH